MLQYKPLITFLLVLHSQYSECISSNDALDCKKDCQDYTSPNYRPQECHDQCSAKEEDDFREEIIEGIQNELHTVRVLGITILFFVLLLLFLLLLLFFKKLKMKETITKFYRKIRNKEPEIRKEKEAQNNRDLVVIANYPRTFGAGIGGFNVEACPQEDEHYPKEQSPVSFNNSKDRMRMPSESTSPDETQVEESGYDNLALSTSTINFHSRPSSPSSPTDINSSSDTVTVSMATLNTTLTTVPLESANDIPSRNDVGRRSTP